MSEDKASALKHSDVEEEPTELEGQYLLRLTPNAAAYLREMLKPGLPNSQNRLKIKIEEDLRHGEVLLDGWTLTAKVMDLPTILECFKTLDQKVFYKTGDICQMLICDDIREKSDTEETLEEEDKGKLYKWPHGVTPPLKNCRQHRFCKTLKKKNSEFLDFEKELKRLFRADLEASSIRYELVSPDEKKEIQSENAEAEDIDEVNLFGEISSSSSQSGESEDDVIDLNAELENQGVEVFSTNNQNYPVEPIEGMLEGPEASENMDDTMEQENASVLQHESETAGQNLGQLLREQIMEEEKAALCQKVQELYRQIYVLQSRQRSLEIQIRSIENEGLKERLQSNLCCIKQEIVDKQREYNYIKTVLQEN